MPFLIFVGILVIVGLWLVGEYNFFATAKTRVGASIQEIGNQLKRQAELIPNLESSVKGYLKHEKSIFDELTAARKEVVSAAGSGDLDKMAKAGARFSEILPRIQLVVESNPEIKGVQVVQDLMGELRDTSDKVMYARRLLIDLTADYNVKRVTFPGNFVAGMFKFGELKGLETPTTGDSFSVSENDMKTPKVNL